ncbi:hypothetical protein MMC30_002796 [Trapelia coarctata]|nr:hypothetical protein [Trapelia coarctata]
MSQPLTRKRSFSNRSVDTTSSQDTPKDVPREVKSAPYKDIRCETLLAKKGSFMGAAPQKTNDAGRHLCKQLLENEQPVPNDSLFRDDIFEKTCDTIRSENEARVILDIMRLIVPSAENLANDGATKLEILKEKVNSSWLQCLPLIDTSPQPDYSVGFREAAFTEDQINKLSPFIGKDSDQSSVMARFDMYFPFLTCEVKCGAEALSIADRQNMHSASVSVKGIVELFRRLGWQQKLHREILAFSVSHDNKSVSIYGHYPLIDGDKTSFYRHPVREFNIRDQDGKEKWTAYKFTRNVYETFVPIHQKRLCSAIDQLPARYDFDVDPSLNFASQPQRGDGDETESNLSSSQNTDSIANTEHTSRSSALTFKKPTPLRR